MHSTLKSQLEKLVENKNTILMGIGNRDRGDDAFGSLLAERVKSAAMFTSIDCEEVPENYTGLAREINPEMIVFADALDFGGQIGEVVLIKPQYLTEDRFSTHRPSLRLVTDYMAAETGADVLLLGVQPGSTGMSMTLSMAVEETLNNLVEIFNNMRQFPLPNGGRGPG